MKKPPELALEKLMKATERLAEGVSAAIDDLTRDGTIQRFEFTFELLWKTFKILLQEKGIDVKTPKDALKESFRLNWITDEQLYLDMLEDRNSRSHVYDQQQATEIFTRIRDQYLPEIKAQLLLIQQRRTPST
jgi:nucleotidyltransferase substrate binding protein (TIGR01987 family)